MRRGIQRDRLADDVAVATEAAAPQEFADDDHGLAFRTPFLFGERASQLRLHPERREKIGRDTRHRHLQRFAVSGEIWVVVRPYGHRLEGPIPVAHQLVTKQSAAEVLGLVLGVHTHQLLRIAVRERPQQQRVGDGENGRVRADSQGQSEDRRERESGVLAQHARAETEIPEERWHDEAIIGRK